MNAVPRSSECQGVWLGVRQWRRLAVVPGTGTAPDRAPRVAIPASRAFGKGLLVALSNPKSILFFTALFPQFVDRSRPAALQFVLMTVTFMALSFGSLMTWTMLAGRARGWLTSSRGARLFDRVAGGAFVAMGCGLLVSGARAAR